MENRNFTEDFSLPVLVDAKTEYTKQLIQILRPYLYEGIQSIYENSKSICKENNEDENILLTFQNLLSNIPKWSQEIIEKEYNREMRFDMRVAHMTSISHFLLYEQLKKFLKTDKNLFEINMVPFIHELKKIKFNDWFITLKEFTSWIEKKGLDPFGINA